MSQAGSLRQIHPESVAPALIAAGLLGARMAKLLLDVALVDLKPKAIYPSMPASAPEGY